MNRRRRAPSSRAWRVCVRGCCGRAGLLSWVRVRRGLKQEEIVNLGLKELVLRAFIKP